MDIVVGTLGLVALLWKAKLLLWLVGFVVLTTIAVIVGPDKFRAWCEKVGWLDKEP